MKIKPVISIIFSGLLFIMLQAPIAASNQISPQQQLQIDQLLAFISHSSCDFIRNGKTYSAKDAVKHIQKKYKYYEDDIDTAEKFIELSATKSALSGKKYHIRCPNKAMMTSQEWLLKQLAEIRAE